MTGPEGVWQLQKCNLNYKRPQIIKLRLTHKTQGCHLRDQEETGIIRGESYQDRTGRQNIHASSQSFVEFVEKDNQFKQFFPQGLLMF